MHPVVFHDVIWFGVMNKNAVVRTFLASLFLVAYTAVSWRLSSTRPEADWIVFAPPAILLFFELAGILRTCRKGNENLDQLVLWVFKMNLALMVTAEIVFMLKA